MVFVLIGLVKRRKACLSALCNSGEKWCPPRGQFSTWTVSEVFIHTHI